MQCGLHVFEEHFNEEKKKKMLLDHIQVIRKDLGEYQRLRGLSQLSS